jgi:hypothetical protein
MKHWANVCDIYLMFCGRDLGKIANILYAEARGGMDLKDPLR